MPQVTRTEHLTAHYTPEDIKRLIQADLEKTYGFVVDIDYICLDITGGDLVDANEGYSGGSGPSWQVTPVKYGGYHVNTTVKPKGDTTDAHASSGEDGTATLQGS